jgi:plastocyanin
MILIRFRPLAVAAVAGLVAGTPSIGRPEAQGSDVAVAIKTFQFTPSPLAVKAGTTVVWTNQDEIRHTVTAGSPSGRDARFGGVLAERGTRYRFTFTERGRYPYFCERHPGMRGEVRVDQDPRGDQ